MDALVFFIIEGKIPVGGFAGQDDVRGGEVGDALRRGENHHVLPVSHHKAGQVDLETAVFGKFDAA